MMLGIVGFWQEGDVKVTELTRDMSKSLFDK
jgi:hypothetical protein